MFRGTEFVLQSKNSTARLFYILFHQFKNNVMKNVMKNVLVDTGKERKHKYVNGWLKVTWQNLFGNCNAWQNQSDCGYWSCVIRREMERIIQKAC